MARIIGLPLNHAKLLCVSIFMFLGHAWSPSADEYLQMKRLLKSLNKPAVKIIETEYGEIFDCVDIYKQPAFDHPLLKNYTIPPKPTSPPKRRNSLVSSNASVLEIKLPHGGCPEGTVPIRRVQMQDLLRAPSISHFGKKHYLNGSSFNSANDLPSYHHWAKIDTKSGDFYGTSAHINVWKPAVASKDQSSGAQFWLVSGSNRQLNSIEAGWMVNGEIFGDLEPRIFIYWTVRHQGFSDGYGQTGCFNTFCPGFVSVHKEVPLGNRFDSISIRNGPQFHFTVSVWKDITQWWLYINDEVVGFWPQQIFSRLNRNAEKVMWGGQVYNHEEDSQKPAYFPPMGSGSYAREGWQRACFMNSIFIVNKKNEYEDGPTDTSTFIDKPMCYDLTDNGIHKDPNWRRYIFLGGPGGQC